MILGGNFNIPDDSNKLLARKLTFKYYHTSIKSINV